MKNESGNHSLAAVVAVVAAVAVAAVARTKVNF